MKITTKHLVQTALLLAICIASQYFKNLSVYITGPIVNATIIIAVLSVGLFSGLLLSIIAPITAFFFTGSPIMAAIPLMFPAIMAGNAILAVSVWYFKEKTSLKFKLPVGMIVGSIFKAVFMGILIVLILLPTFGDQIAAKLEAAGFKKSTYKKSKKKAGVRSVKDGFLWYWTLPEVEKPIENGQEVTGEDDLPV